MTVAEELKIHTGEKPNNLVQTIERATLLITILSEYPKGLSLGDLSAEVGLPKGTAHRLLSSLLYFGWVRQDSATKFYQLGFKLMELGNVVLSHIDLRNEARPILRHLADAIGETVHLVVQDHDEVIYIDKVETMHKKNGLQMISRLGTRIPMHCSSVGKVILANLPPFEREDILTRTGLLRRTNNTICDPNEFAAHLQRIRRQGAAIDDEENEVGIRCVAAPIRDVSGNTVAAVSISAPAVRVSINLLESELKEKIIATAAAISEKLGYYDN